MVKLITILVVPKGVTLVEVLAVLSIMIMMVFLTVQGIHTLRQHQQRHLAQSLLVDLRYAYNMAKTQRLNVSICAARDYSATDCVSDRNHSHWQYGWVIFKDPKRLFKVEQKKDILRVFQLDNDVLTVMSGSNLGAGLSFSGTRLFSQGAARGLGTGTIEVCGKGLKKENLKLDMQGGVRLEHSSDICL